MNKEEIDYDFRVFVKMTEIGNIYFGFSPPDLKITRTTSLLWTSRPLFYYNSYEKEIHYKYKDDFGNTFWKKYFIMKDICDLCKYIKSCIESEEITTKNVYEVTFDDYKRLIFQMFHESSPIKYKEERSDMVKYPLPATKVNVPPKLKDFEKEKIIITNTKDLSKELPLINSDAYLIVAGDGNTGTINSKTENIKINKKLLLL